MQKLFLALAICSSFATIAENGPNEKYMSVKSQKAYINKVAKEIRREHWRAGHVDVESRQSHLSKFEIDDLVRQDNNYHDTLDSDEVSELYRCYYRSTCEVYLVNITSSYYSGWGQQYFYLLLNTKEKRHEEYSHLVYAE